MPASIIALPTNIVLSNPDYTVEYESTNAIKLLGKALANAKNAAN